jgi:hypothetical protein
MKEKKILHKLLHNYKCFLLKSTANFSVLSLCDVILLSYILFLSLNLI